MNQLAITVRPTASGRKLLVELDADKLERLASTLGLYNPDFLESVGKAERDYRAGRVYKVSSLRKWRSRE